MFGAAGNLASDSAREVSHHFTFGADLVLFGAIIWYMLDKHRRGDGNGKLPIVLTVLGSVLVLLDPIRHLLLDHNIGGNSLGMFSEDGGLTCVGRFCQVCTICGLLSFMAGIALFIKLPEKLSELTRS